MRVKVGMVSLGCPKNQVDAEVLLGMLPIEEFEIVAENEDADAVIINTCGFIDAAKEESIEHILEYCGLKESGQLKSVIVTGCLAERYQDEIAAEIPEIDVVLGIGENESIRSAILQSVGGGERLLSFSDKYNMPLEGKRTFLSAPYTAYLKIAEGCDNRCTYCAIPMIRGGFRSRTMESILSEAEALVAAGTRELILVAQDTSRYGEELYGEARLATLLRELAHIDGVKWIRVLYCYPERITDELLTVIREEDKIVKYLDIPLQHANSEVLRRMNRHGDRAWITNLLQKIRAEVPGITLRTSLIAGFPGETEEAFEELCEFVKEIRFDRMGCFAYSIEEGTPAAKLPNQLSEEEKRRRANIVTELQASINFEQAEEAVGEEKWLLVEEFDEDEGMFVARSAADAPEIDMKVYLKTDKPLSLGTFVFAKITDTYGMDTIGTVLEEEELR